MTVHTADIIEIEQLVARYNHAIDKGDGEKWADCFIESGIMDAGGQLIEGKEALAEFAVRFRAGVRCPRHVTHNMVVDVEDETATLTAYVHMWDSVGDPPVVKLAASGVYDDRLVKREGTWRFIRRTLVLDP